MLWLHLVIFFNHALKVINIITLSEILGQNLKNYSNYSYHVKNQDFIEIQKRYHYSFQYNSMTK